ncbi:MAG: dTMP kinase [Gammaproteobacteria bacterium]
MSDSERRAQAASGLLITLEGIEGVGKSTQAQFVSNWFSQRGRDTLLTREPGGTAAGEAIRSILLDKSQTGLHADAELLLIFAARAQHLQELVLPALKAGQVVVCDRFTDASYAYQGGGRGLAEDRIETLEQWVQQGLQPDLTLLLDAQVSVGRQRAGRRSSADRFEMEAVSFFEKVREAYLQRAATHDRICVIDASGTPADVSSEIARVLAVWST